MTDKKAPAGFALLDPFRLTNRIIPAAWRLAAGTIALSVRIPATIVLASVRRVQRARIVRW